jgi:2',3'-cyclic-nucleotide 2'-phosphodiesterase (5'-nucleotidase family)
MKSQKNPTFRRLLILALLALATLAGCERLASWSGGDDRVTLTILYTNDEHGWLAPTEEHGGAAGMVRRWREVEGYTEEGPFLVLSGGDTWTGPAISTWFDGEPMIEVMNAMGYDGAAVGNHEFDFGVEGLRARSAQAEFPFLAANLLDAGTGEHADLVVPCVVQEVAGVRVGIIGLASRLTPATTMPTYVADFTFDAYADTLRTVAPQARDDGAEILVAITHLCGIDLRALAPTAAELGIAMLGGGHCNERISQTVDGVILVEAGWQLRAYGRVDLLFDPAAGRVVESTVELKGNPPGDGDPEIAVLVDQWQAELDDALLVPIGYTRDGIGRHSNAMHNMVADAWLAAYPADIAMCNPGGFRQDIDPGEITLADIVGVLPFENTLVDAELTGEQVVAAYQHGVRRPAVGGMHRAGAKYRVNGEPLDPDGIYRVLINNFMYAGGDDYAFAEYDPDAYETGIDWRQPVIAWITSLETTPDDPLENYLDEGSR